MPSVESYLSRELQVRFIDARNIAAEARIALGIQGYPSSEDMGPLREEAMRIFDRKSAEEQQKLRRMNLDLEATKIPSRSSSMADLSARGDTSSVCSTSSATRGTRKSFLSNSLR